jgi:RNA polymerase sporulation-specific sigma factor
MDRQDLVVENMKLVYQVWHNHFNWPKNSKHMDEFIGEGMIGLIKAAKYYDSSLGFTFSTFAYPCIKRQMARIVQSQNRRKRKGELKTISLHKKVFDDTGDLFIDTIGDDDPGFEEVEKKVDYTAFIDEMFSGLSESERDLLATYYGLNGNPKSAATIAKETGTPKNTVFKRLYVLRKKLRDQYKDKWVKLNA